MKQILLSAVLFLLYVSSNAQSGCTSYNLNAGDSLVFNRLIPAAYTPPPADLKGKEKFEYLKKMMEDMKNGKGMRQGRASFFITAKDLTATGVILHTKLTLDNPPNKLTIPYIFECYNDTLFVNQEDPYTETEGVGVTYAGPVIYPMNMKVGDLLPDSKIITVGYKRSGSQKMMLPYISKTTTTHHLDANYKELYSTVDNTYKSKEVTNNFSSITTFETIYANREVTADTTISYKGKNYKGFTIVSSVLSSPSVQVTADYLQNAMQRTIKRNLAKAAKRLDDDEKGLLTTIMREVFVPEIGVVSSVLTKKDGSIFSKTWLAD